MSWKLLSKTERRAYKDRQEPNISQRSDHVSKIEMDQRKRIKKQHVIDKAISEMIQSGMRKHMLEKLEVFLISVNHFCKHQTSEYVPAEMAIVKYNLESGILGKFHELINPTQLPLGLAHEASQYSRETHALPIPPNALGETDFSIVLRKVLKFTGYNEPHKILPLFTDTEEISAVESLLTQLNKASKTSFQFLVISLAEFFFHLKRGTEKYGLDICIFPDKTIAEILLKNDVYEYTTGLACAYHENVEHPQFCALSKVCRWSFTISSNCCPDLSIAVIHGCHVPSNTEKIQVNESSPSDTILSQFDGMSTDSAAQSLFALSRNERRHATRPSAGTSQNLKTELVDKAAATTNSFYMVESVYGTNLPMEGIGKQTKVIQVHQPSSGRGRGILMDTNLNESSSNGFSVKGTGYGRGEWLADNGNNPVLQGAGRGQNLLIGSTPIGIDTTYCSHDVVRGRGAARRTSSIGKISSYRRRHM